VLLMHHFHAWTMGFWVFVGEHTTSLIAGPNLTPIHALPHEANPRLDYVPIVSNLPPYKFVENVRQKRDREALPSHDLTFVARQSMMPFFTMQMLRLKQ
jgi:hypothetical protein